MNDPTSIESLICDFDLGALKYSSDGLIPSVVVDENGAVLMVAYMDRTALERSIHSGRTWFYSRSRQQYWAKGETSGNIQIIKEIRSDCDLDTLLVKVVQIGDGACHTGEYSCFFNTVAKENR